MKKFALVILVCLLLISVSVSAFWPFDRVTGKVVDNTLMNNSDDCIDTDNGVFSMVPGIVRYKRFLGTNERVDVCRSKGRYLREYYCDSKGKMRAKTIRCKGGCNTTEIEFRGDTYEVGFCIPPAPSCKEIGPGKIRDELGKIYRSGCGKGDDRNKYKKYSCGVNIQVSDITYSSIAGGGGTSPNSVTLKLLGKSLTLEEGATETITIDSMNYEITVEAITQDSATITLKETMRVGDSTIDKGEETITLDEGTSGIIGEDKFISVVVDDCSELADGKCTSLGCYGACVDTDPENDINVAGVVTVIEKGEEKTYSDTCHPTKNAVKQYYCRNGRAYLYKRGDYSWLSCGRDRKCVVDEATGAGKCVDKEEAGETTSLEGLRRIVQSLQERIEALEEAVSELQEALFAEE